MPCPETSAIQGICIGGQLADPCTNGDNLFEQINVQVYIEGATPFACLPDTGAVLAARTGGLLWDSNLDTDDGEPMFPAGNDGCWNTCELYPNVADDPNGAISPGGTTYRILVTYLGAPIIDLSGIQLSADLVYDLSGAGGCVNIKDLIGSFIPPNTTQDTICDLIDACGVQGTDSVSSLTSTTAADGTVTITHSPGDGSPATTVTIPPGSVSAVTTTANADGSVTVSHDPGDGSTATTFDIPPPTCDALIDLPDAPAGADLANVVVQLDAAGDPIACFIGSRCCTVDTTLIDPATGDPVIVVVDTDTGTATYYDQNGQAWAGDPATLELPDSACSVTGGNGLTGTPSGAYTDGCTIEPLPANGDPEAGFPAAGFPEGWRQLFSGGTTGTETWIVLNDTNGALQWHQSA